MRHLRRHTAHTGSPRRLVPCSSPRRQRWGASRDSRCPAGHPCATPQGASEMHRGPPLASPSVSPWLSTAAPFPQPRHIWQELTQPTFSFPRRQPLCRPRRANSVVVHLQPAAGVRCGSRRLPAHRWSPAPCSPKRDPSPGWGWSNPPLHPARLQLHVHPKHPRKTVYKLTVLLNINKLYIII